MNGPALAAIALSLIFAFTNGFQDSGSNAATLVACRAASPRRAALLVAGAGAAGAVLGGSAVALTVFGLVTLGNGDTAVRVTISAVTGATIWNLITWRLGLPSSSTYALVGGLIGAAVTAGGAGSVSWGLAELTGPSHAFVGVTKVLVFLAVSVGIGLLGGYAVLRTSSVLLRNARRRLNLAIMRAQWLTAGLLAFGSGANNAQKQMGLIAMVLVATGSLAALEIPPWVRVACALALGLGALVGGWRIMRRLGMGVFTIEPIHSLDSQVTAGAAIAISTVIGAPISSTQVIASSVVGVGAAENARNVRWSIGRDMFLSWAVTIPFSAMVSSATFAVISHVLT